jgi:uncharacterized membrane protein
VLRLYAVAVPTFFVVDIVWLGLVARGFYRDQLGDLLRSDTNWLAAVAFYLLFVAGLVILVIEPAVATGSLGQAVSKGALFGLVAYATYDLTNLATLRGWPLPMTLVDLAWGAALAATVTAVTYFVADRAGW